MGAYLKAILAAKKSTPKSTARCAAWYRASGVLIKIKSKLQSMGQRKSIRDSETFPQVNDDLQKMLEDCLEQLVEACGEEATGDQLLIDEMYSKLETPWTCS